MALLGFLSTLLVSAPACSSIVYSIEVGVPLPHTVYTFDTSSPDVLTPLGPASIPFFNYGIGFDSLGTTLYTIDTISRLGVINQTDGAYTLLGSVTGILPNHNVDGLAADPTTGNIFLISNNGFTGVTALYQLDPETRVATLIGSQSVVRWLVDLAFDTTGNLYSVGLDTNSLYRINTTSGDTTLIGALGLDIIGQQGLAFDQGTSSLYGVIGNRDLDNYAFGVIDVDTGLFSPSNYVDNPRKIAIAPARIPEPGSYILVLTGFGILLLQARVGTKNRFAGRCT